MVLDEECNSVYLSDLLPARFPRFFSDFVSVLTQHQISVMEISGTRDIWVRDFMPVQISRREFVQFKYRPSYLRRYPNLLTTPEHLPIRNDLRPQESDIVLDGGNVIKGKGWAIITERVFRENPHHQPSQLRTKLETILGGNVIVIPEDPSDILGHADGMVRYYSEDCVLINRYHSIDARLKLSLKKALDSAHLKYIEIPYNPYTNRSTFDARGCYINFLHLKQLLLIPTFGLPEETEMIKTFSQLFSIPIETLDCSEISQEGGALNCVTWSIQE